MNITILRNLALLFVIIGILFSGYLTVTSLSGTCLIEGGCAEFLGTPACTYGLVMYIILLILFAYIIKKKSGENTGLKLILLVSFIGILFAGSLTFQEYLGQKPLSVCAMGLGMYILIFILSIAYKMKK
ncbi:MAG: hypothetical protein ABIH52_01875 [Candidatus Aenigmatarchaeota archaeon]